MTVSGYIPAKHVECEAHDDVPTAVAKFRAAYGKYAVIEDIGGRAVSGFCEACDTPVFEDDPWRRYDGEDGIHLHGECCGD
jgi:hypothetical protein